MKKVLLLLSIAFLILFVSCESTKGTANSLVDDDITVVDQSKDGEEDSEEDSSEDLASKKSNIEDLISKTDDARQKAIDAGAKNLYPDAFAVLDEAYEGLKSLNDGKDHSSEYAELKARYEALEKAAAAKKLKERIDNENLSVNAPADYAKGEAALASFDEMLPGVVALAKTLSVKASVDDKPTDVIEAAVGIPVKELLSKANEAYDSYYSVYFKSYKKFAVDERKNALTKKKAADAVKAQVARKEEYKSFADMIVKGDSSFATSNPENAFNSYKKAAESYDALAKDVAEKRAAAQKAIEEAKAKVKAAEAYAAEADIVKPLDEIVDGIEEADAVLLEKDEFKNPEEQIIEINETIEGVAE